MGVDHALSKQISYYRRLCCVLGVCFLILSTAFVILVVVAWPCLTSPSTACTCDCPTVRADVAVDQSDVAPLIVGDIYDSPRRTASNDTITSNSTNAVIATSNSASSGSSHGHHSHPHDAMLFLLNALIIGTLVLHLTTHPKLHSIQFTSALFMLGMIYSLVQEGLQLHTKLGVLGRSYTMWMDIDPHLILFTLLPALLAGDAMAIDTSVVKRVANQCIYLAGPGVLIGALLTAGFIMLYLGWSFELALTTGAILAATDPVAVVGLLKQLGAPPTLTVQIAGESLLNDGTAIVLYIMAYEMLQGVTYDAPKISIFIVRKALCACGLGWVIGWVFVIWINAASNKFEHHSSTIQICLTLCCAYWSFIMAEGVLDMSGVLCTVAASIVLADKMWMSIVEKESMHIVWHTFEFIGNTLIFFLAGALTGNCMVHIPAIDYLHLLVLYVVSMLIRGFIIFGSRPILQYLSPDRTPVKKSEALIMTVGGLRGAVGLALAIQVSANKDNAIEDDMDAQRVLFFTGGIATLTLVINASICPALVKATGLVQTDEAKKKVMMILHEKMMSMASSKIESKGVRTVLDEMLSEVKREIDHKYTHKKHVWDPLLHHGSGKNDASDDLNAADQAGSAEGFERQISKASGASATFARQISPAISVASSAVTKVSGWFDSQGEDRLPSGPDLVHNYKSAKELFEKAHKALGKNVHYLVHIKIDELHDEAALLESVHHDEPDSDMVRAAGVAFLSLVRAQYWHQIEKGEFIEGSTHPEVLLGSIAIGLQHGSTLQDFDFIVQELGLTESDIQAKVNEIGARSSSRRKSSRMSLSSVSDSLASFGAHTSRRSHGSHGEEGEMPQTSTGTGRSSISTSISNLANRSSMVRKTSRSLKDVFDVSGQVASTRKQGSESESCAKQVVGSTAFTAFMTVAILLNVINVFVEESFEEEQTDNNTVWLVIEIVFNVIFFWEFVMKFMAVRIAYFKQAWNIFDFTLIITGIFGIILQIVLLNAEENDVGAADEGNVSQEARIMRVNRVFRVMRLVRVFRLVKFIQLLRAKLAGNEVSVELAQHLRKVTLLTAYIKATHHSQEELINYFGAPKRSNVAQARCLVESQTNLMRAGAMALVELKKVNVTILENLSILRESGEITDALSEFICEAAEVDVISAREAEHLLSPLRERQRNWNLIMRESEMGIIRSSYKNMKGSQVLYGANPCADQNDPRISRRSTGSANSIRSSEAGGEESKDQDSSRQSSKSSPPESSGMGTKIEPSEPSTPLTDSRQASKKGSLEQPDEKVHNKVCDIESFDVTVDDIPVVFGEHSMTTPGLEGHPAPVVIPPQPYSCISDI